MTFRVGQKVVCVAVPGGGYGDELLPVKGDIYTIRALRVFSQGEGVALCEIKNDARNYGPDGVHEAYFYVGCFRPLVTRKNDISIFTRILDDVSKKQFEEASFHS